MNPHLCLLTRIAGLANQYTTRRDYIIDQFAEEFNLRIGVVSEKSNIDYFTGCNVYTAYPKEGSKVMSEKATVEKEALLSFVPPTSGMFVWVGFFRS